MAYFPQSGSVAVFQSVPTNLVGTVSVVSHSPQSVATLQGTNPWLSQIVSSVATRPTPASVQLIGGNALIGSVAQAGNWFMGPSSVQLMAGINNAGSITAIQGTNPWNIQPTSGSIFAYQAAGSVMAVNTTVTTGNSSVLILSGNATIGSVTAYQGVNPWVITGSIQGGGSGTEYAEDTLVTSVTGTAIMFRRSQTTSLMAVVNPVNPLPVVGSVSGTVSVNPSSVQVLGGIAVLGSVATLQGTNPWVVGNSSVTVMNAIPPHSVSGVGTFAVTQSGTWATSMVGVASVTQAGAWNVGVIGSVAAILSGGSSVIAVLQAPSIAGTYAEDSAHTSAERGLFTLGVRNDATSSFVSANLEYTPFGVDSAGRMITKPFAADHSSVFGTGSVNGAASVIVLVAPPTGLRNYATDIMIANTGSVATLVDITAGGGSILARTIAPAGGGSNIIGLQSPIAAQTGSPMNIASGTASSILYGTIYGYVAP